MSLFYTFCPRCGFKGECFPIHEETRDRDAIDDVVDVAVAADYIGELTKEFNRRLRESEERYRTADHETYVQRQLRNDLEARRHELELEIARLKTELARLKEEKSKPIVKAGDDKASSRFSLLEID